MSAEGSSAGAPGPAYGPDALGDHLNRQAAPARDPRTARPSDSRSLGEDGEQPIWRSTRRRARDAPRPASALDSDDGVEDEEPEPRPKRRQLRGRKAKAQASADKGGRVTIQGGRVRGDSEEEEVAAPASDVLEAFWPCGQCWKKFRRSGVMPLSKGTEVPCREPDGSGMACLVCSESNGPCDWVVKADPTFKQRANPPLSALLRECPLARNAVRKALEYIEGDQGHVLAPPEWYPNGHLKRQAKLAAEFKADVKRADSALSEAKRRVLLAGGIDPDTNRPLSGTNTALPAPVSSPSGVLVPAAASGPAVPAVAAFADADRARLDGVITAMNRFAAEERQHKAEMLAEAKKQTTAAEATARAARATAHDTSLLLAEARRNTGTTQRSAAAFRTYLSRAVAREVDIVNGQRIINRGLAAVLGIELEEPPAVARAAADAAADLDRDDAADDPAGRAAPGPAEGGEGDEE